MALPAEQLVAPRAVAGCGARLAAEVALRLEYHNSLGSPGRLGSHGSLGSLGSLGNLGILRSLGSLGSLGSRDKGGAGEKVKIKRRVCFFEVLLISLLKEIMMENYITGN